MVERDSGEEFAGADALREVIQPGVGFTDERFGRVWRGSYTSVREALWWSNASDSVYLFCNRYLPVQIGRAGTNRSCVTIYFAGADALR